MRHDQHGISEPGQKLFEPAQAVEVQVVGGLVQDQEVGVREKGTGQRRPRALSPACDRSRSVQDVRRQPDSLGHPLHPVLVVLAAEGLVLLQELGVPCLDSPQPAPGMALYLQRALGQLLFQPEEAVEGGHDPVPESALDGVVGQLRDIGHPQPGRADTVPESGSISPTSTRSSEVLPLPLDPTSPMRDRSSTSTSTPSKTSTSP